MLAPIIFNMTGDTRWVMTSCDPKLLGHPATFGKKYLMSVTDGIGQTPCSFEHYLVLSNSQQDLQAPSADCRKTLPHDRYWGALYNTIPKFGVSQKTFGAKNMQNSGRFYATLDFDHEYLWVKISKIGNTCDRGDNSSHVQRKKSGKLWSTKYKVGHVSLDPT